MSMQWKCMLLFLLPSFDFWFWFFWQFDRHPCKCWSRQYSQRGTCHYASDPYCSGSPYPGHQFACCSWLAFVSCADSTAQCRKSSEVMLIRSAFQLLILKNYKTLLCRWSWGGNRLFDEVGDTERSFWAGYRATEVIFYERRIFW